MAEFMIDITLPDEMDEAFIAKIPEQRVMVNRLMVKGIVLSYSLSINRSKLWITMDASSKQEIMRRLNMFPLIDYFTYEIHLLAFHNAPVMKVPPFSVN
jgi:muconolactone delta-isomerase